MNNEPNDAASNPLTETDKNRHGFGRPLYHLGLALALGGGLAALYGTVPTQAMATSTAASSASATAGRVPAGRSATKAAGGDADLSIELSSGSLASKPQRVTWTVAVHNNGPGIDPGPISVIHALPANASDITVSGAGWKCDFDQDGVTISCVDDSALGVRQKRQLAVRANIEPSRTSVSTASVVGSGNDPDLTNNSAADVTRNRASDEASATSKPATARTKASAPSTSTGATAGGQLPRTGTNGIAALAAAGFGLVLFGKRLERFGAVGRRSARL